jgi:hypothetical protein
MAELDMIAEVEMEAMIEDAAAAVEIEEEDTGLTHAFNLIISLLTR